MSAEGDRIVAYTMAEMNGTTVEVELERQARWRAERDQMIADRQAGTIQRPDWCFCDDGYWMRGKEDPACRHEEMAELAGYRELGTPEDWGKLINKVARLEAMLLGTTRYIREDVLERIAAEAGIATVGADEPGKPNANFRIVNDICDWVADIKRRGDEQGRPG